MLASARSTNFCMTSPFESNNWVQATPDSAFCLFVSKGTGAPDPTVSN
jgi:hypothetical protein